MFLINLLSITDKLRLLTIITPFYALLLTNSDYSIKTVKGIVNLD